MDGGIIQLGDFLSRSRQYLSEAGMAKATKEIVVWAYLSAMGPVLSRGLSEKAEAVRDVDSAIQFAFAPSYHGLSISVQQVKEEMTELLGLVKGLKPKTLLEIGTANGGTLFLFTRVASADAVILSVDLPATLISGGYSEWRRRLYESFALDQQSISCFRSDSHSPETSKLVKGRLGEKTLDLLFIDGDHSYRGVKMDFEMYSPLVRKGGMIVLHDIAPHRDKIVGVSNYWNELRNEYATVEILAKPDQGWAGIGVVHK